MAEKSICKECITKPCQFLEGDPKCVERLEQEKKSLMSELRGKDRLIKKLEKEVYRIGSWE